MCAYLAIPFLPQSWKWKMGRSNISFLSFRVIFHFHDYGRKSNSQTRFCLGGILGGSFSYQSPPRVLGWPNRHTLVTWKFAEINRTHQLWRWTFQSTRWIPTWILYNKSYSKNPMETKYHFSCGEMYDSTYNMGFWPDFILDHWTKNATIGWFKSPAN